MVRIYHGFQQQLTFPGFSHIRNFLGFSNIRHFRGFSHVRNLKFPRISMAARDCGLLAEGLYVRRLYLRDGFPPEPEV